LSEDADEVTEISDEEYVQQVVKAVNDFVEKYLIRQANAVIDVFENLDDDPYGDTTDIEALRFNVLKAVGVTELD
jgi:hypothetical protein